MPFRSAKGDKMVYLNDLTVEIHFHIKVVTASWQNLSETNITHEETFIRVRCFSGHVSYNNRRRAIYRFRLCNQCHHHQ